MKIKYLLLLFFFMVSSGMISATDRSIEVNILESDADEALTKMYHAYPFTKDIISKSAGYLVFPSLKSAGILIGGTYGKGILFEEKQSVSEYRYVAMTQGLQLGAQAYDVVIVFLTPKVLKRFRLNKDSGFFNTRWNTKFSASLVVLNSGISSRMDMDYRNQPVLYFVSDQKGLMYKFSLDVVNIYPSK